MRPRPSVVSLALTIIALLHAWWGLKQLAGSAILPALSQLVSAGGLLLAAAGVRSRLTLSTGLAIAAAATSIRFLANLGNPGPFMVPGAALILGMGLAAWGARAAEGPSPFAGLALRGGFLLMGLAYSGFTAFIALGGGSTFDVAEIVTRVLMALAAAVYVDAPHLPSVGRSRERAGPAAP